MGKAKRRTKQGEYEIAGDARRIVPLKAGYCYIFSANGKTNHVKRDSEEFTRLIEQLRESLGDDRVNLELERLK